MLIPTSLLLFQAEHRTMASFVLAMIVNNYQPGRVSILLSTTALIVLSSLQLKGGGGQGQGQILVVLQS